MILPFTLARKIAKFQFHETSQIFWLVVRMCDHRLQCMHALAIQLVQSALIKIFVRKIYGACHNKKFCIGAFTLLTSRFLKSRHFDPTIYTCAKNREVSVSRNFAIFWLVVRMCDHRLQCMHLCMQCMQYAWGPRISIHVSKSARS